MGYTPSFTPQYENGWENLPSETSPITAEAFNAYDDAIENIENYLASDESQANLADAYDATETYSEGDYRIHNGTLYKCLEDIDEPEEFDPEKWESVIVTEEMATSGGTTVIANPSGQATETLNKLQVAETIYGISGGGGSANIWEGTQAELEEQFDDIPNETAIIVTDDEQEVVEGGTIYSEEEQVIGLWVDNKPLYQKTFVLSNPLTISANSWGTVDTLTEQINVIGAQGVLVDVSGEHVYYIVGGNCDTSNALTVLNYRNVAIQLNRITITYTKPTDAPLDAVVGKKTMYIASSDCYSTEEKEVGCWTDGKPLYQKTLIIEPTSSDFSVDIASLNIDKLIDRQATLTRIVNGTSNIQQKDVQYRTETSSNNNYGLVCELRDSVMQVSISGYLYTEIDEIRVTLQYTKTTDTAGSGSYTPASGKAVYYSTNEQVIGKWSNGKPLYRKCISIASFSSNDVLIANAIYYGNFLLSNYISDVDMAFLDLNHSYLGTSSTFTRTILNAQYEADTGYFTLFTIYSRQNVPLTLVIEYTKTTD